MNSNNKDILKVVDELRWALPPNFHDQLVEKFYEEAAEVADRNHCHLGSSKRVLWERRLDWILTNRWTGIPVMILLLALVMWITISAANVPSGFLATLLVGKGQSWLQQGADFLNLPWWLSGFFIDGIYLTCAWVVSVMLPPMMIFFPLFTMLEDFGYLPRVAFNLDRLFQRVGAHGKQALTMTMGWGCNAAGVTAARIIDSPRERLIAIITNNFAICNGRWPTQFLMATVFLGALVPEVYASAVASGAVLLVTLLGVAITFATSWLLSRTILKGEASTFSLELPPYRPPQILKTLYTSLIDRTIFVLWRAIVFAVPAGGVIWLVANIKIFDLSLAEHLITFLDPVGLFIGLNGVILLAYIIAIPANEIVIPTVLMLTVIVSGVTSSASQGAGVLFEAENHRALVSLLHAGGWTVKTAVCLMLFSLCHNPCSTTIYTIYKETGSARWTAVATLLPLSIGVVLCGIVATIF